MDWVQKLAEKRLEAEKRRKEDLDRLRWVEQAIAKKSAALWDELRDCAKSVVLEYNKPFPDPPVRFEEVENSYCFDVVRFGTPQVKATVHLSSATDCIEFTVSRSFIPGHPVEEEGPPIATFLTADGSLGLRSEAGKLLTVEKAMRSFLEKVL